MQNDPANDQQMRTLLVAAITLSIFLWDIAYRNCLMLILLIIALVGYGVGTNHQYFVSCQQFQLAGDNVPEDCGDWVIVE